MVDVALWTFEHPVNVTATYLTQITWEPNTFSASSIGNFSLNLWLLHADDTKDPVQHDYLNILLAGNDVCSAKWERPLANVIENQNVYNNSVWWTPPTSEIDIYVPQPGVHQLAWEEHFSNPDAMPLKTAFKGFSRGFNILPLPGLSSSTTSISTTSTTSTPSSTQAINTTVKLVHTSSSAEKSSAPLTSVSPTNTSVNSDRKIILGLGVSLGLLAIYSVASTIFLLRRHKLGKKRSHLIAELGSEPMRGSESEQKSIISKSIPRNFRAELPGSE